MWTGVDEYRVRVRLGGPSSRVVTGQVSLRVEDASPALDIHALLEDLADSCDPLDEQELLSKLRRRTETAGGAQADAAIAFDHAISVSAPVTGREAWLVVSGRLTISWHEGQLASRWSFDFPVTTLSPTSRSNAERGAINQRAICTIEFDRAGEVLHAGPPTPEALLEAAEQSASAPIRPLLKRLDERWVTMAAYERPRDAASIAQSIASLLESHEGIQRLRVRVRELSSALCTWQVADSGWLDQSVAAIECKAIQSITASG
jgi:GTP cyclohydrolase FolE2